MKPAADLALRLALLTLVLAVIAGSRASGFPATSEAVAMPVTTGSGTSAASLVPGASHGAPYLPAGGAPASAEPIRVRTGNFEGAIGSALIGGWASWFDVGPGLYAAAGPLLRQALGSGWRGQYVTVEGNGRSVTLVLSDWCACGDRHGTPTIIDLSRDAFAELEDPSRGLVRVSIEIDGPAHEADDRMRLESMDLPQTDSTEGTP